MANRDQIVRILGLAHALGASRHGVVLKAWADAKGWKVRSVYRDIEALEAAGFPIESENGRYRLVDGWAPPGQAGVTTDEVAALFVARQLASGVKVTGFGRALDRLWTKVTSTATSTTAPRRRQSRLVPESPVGIATRVPGAHDYEKHRKTIEMLERALATHKVVQLRYRALSTGALSARDVEPGDLHWDPALETLYLIAWCRLRRAVRVFAVHRIAACALSESGFVPRAETRSRHALRDAFRVWRDEHVESVVIEFAAPVAEEIAERRWHASQRIQKGRNGAVLLGMEVAGLGEIERWVMGYGANARVLAPTAFAERIADLKRAAWEAENEVREPVPRGMPWPY